MKLFPNDDGSFSAQGTCPLHNRPLCVEGDTRAIARQNWMHEFARRYAHAESLSAYTIEESRDEVHAYKQP